MLGTSRLSRRLIVAGVGAATMLAAWTSPAQAASTGNNASITMNKTVSSTSINPNLSLTLAVDKSSAIPGDKLTYTATVTNTGASLGLTGQFQAQNDGSVLATISDYYDEVEYFTPSTHVWTALAGVQVTAPGYTPLLQSPAKTGLNLTLVPMNASGVTYPSSGDSIIGTKIATTAVAGWNYTAVLPLSLSQIATLSDSTKVAGIRNVVHFEATPRDIAQGQPFKFRTTFTDPFLSQTGAVGNIVVAVTLPDGTIATFNSTNTSAFVSLAAGASANVTATLSVPVAPAKASGQDDASYFAGLKSLEGTLLKADATASGSATGGPVTASAPPAVTTVEHLPIVSLKKDGPATTAAGTTEANPLALANAGGAAASALAVVDSVPAGGTATIAGLAATLAPGATTTATANFPVPLTQVAGSLTDTASLTWQDANGNSYGPVSSSFTTSVTNTLNGATLALTPGGPLVAVKGNQVTVTATLLDASNKPVANQAVLLAVTGANPTSQSGTTDANGTVQFTYAGTAGGTDQVQASVSSGPTTLHSNTVTVNWLVPIVAASTSPVNATFYPDQGCNCFTATPSLAPIFSTTLPTININPPGGSIPHMPPNLVGTDSRPMMSVQTDTVGNFAGASVVQGFDANGGFHQLGVGDMGSFQAVFTGTLTVAKGGNLLLSFFSDDGFMIGIPNGVTYVSGYLYNPPASGLTPFKSYPVVGSYNGNTAPQERDVTVNFPAPGEYPYEIDYFECCGDGLAFTFGTGGNAGMPPTGTLALSPFSLTNKAVGSPSTLSVAAMDASGSPLPNLGVTLIITGANAQQLQATTDSTGFANFTYQGVNAGQDSLQAFAPISGVQEMSSILSQQWTPAPPAPTITSPSPADGTMISKAVPISASFAPPAGQTIVSWSVQYQALDPGPILTINSGTGTPPATLGTFDPSLLPNDTYSIYITAQASGGGTQTITTTVVVFGYLKPGRYTTTYQDMSVPINGFQMQVRRTYDSFDKSQGDFGIGWHVGISNFRVTTNRVFGGGGWVEYNTQCGLGLCLTAFRNTAPRFVTVVFPDQHTEVFDFSASGGSNVFFSAGPVYTARAGSGTTSTLSAVGDTSLFYKDDGNLYDSNGGFYAPQQFKLTTHDGTVLILDTHQGLVSMTNRSGEFFQMSPSGFLARSGEGIAFTRDPEGRITQIQGPAGQILKYAYVSDDNLNVFTDANGNSTQFNYDGNHNLLSAVGPGGVPLQTEQYDSSGRLIAITDANGNTTQVTNNVAGQQQTIIDPNGKLTTVLTMDDLGDVVRQDQVFDGKTLTTTATYDSVGRPLSKTDPLGHKWTVTYDASGDVLAVTDPLGNGINATFDSFGAPLTFTDATGNVSRYAYDSAGNLVSFTNALGQIDQFGYNGGGFTGSHTDALGRTWVYNPDGFGNLDTIRDPNGQNWRWHYDTLGNMTQSIDPAGDTTNYTYDPMGNLVTVTDALGHVTTLTYNGLNEIVSRTDALGKTTTYTYDGNRNLTSSTDPLGNIKRYTYDADARLTSSTDPTGATRSYTYDGSGRLLSETDPLGRVTTYVYDEAGRLTSKTLPNGGVISYGFDSAGHQTSVTDALGHKTVYAYDANGRLVAQTDPNGHTTSYTLDALGRQITITDPQGGKVKQTYDAAGQLASVTDQLGNVTSYGYDGAGNRISVTDPLGHVTSYQFDAANRLNAVTDPLSRFVIYNHDAMGQVTSTRLFSGIFTRSQFDADGRLTASIDGLGNTTSYAYDAAGNRVSMTDPNGNTTGYGYDAAGRQTSITDALGGKVTISYDGAGQETSVTVPRGATTKFTYDSLGNVLTQTDPSGGTTSYAYDATGRQTSVTDPRGINVGQSYDAAGQLTGIAFPGGSIGFTYDSLGRRTAMTDPTGTTNYSYDAASRLVSVAAPQGTVGYTYDAAGNRSNMAVPGRGTIHYTYDAANELSTLTDWAGNVFSFTYMADGMPASISRPGGVVTAYGYDGADRLTSVHNDGPSGAIARFDYTLDANGNRTSMSSAAGTESYSFDALSRLTAASYPNGDHATYTYDAAGNRLSSTLNSTTTNYTYDVAGRLTSAGSTPVAHDAAGNITSVGSDTFTWDWAGRLASSNVSGVASSYAYDGEGVRVGQTIAGTAINYVWDRAGSLPLLVDDGTQGYVQTDQGVLEQVGGTTTYPLTDALGSVRTVETPTPSVLSTASYDVFGAVRSQSGQQSIFGFTGQQTDTTGLSFLRARYYSPALGQFMSADSVQPNGPGTQGYNEYSYAANDPVTLTDPSGHVTFAETALNLETRVLNAIRGLGPAGVAVATAYLAVRAALAFAAEACVANLLACAVVGAEVIGEGTYLVSSLVDTIVGPRPHLEYRPITLPWAPPTPGVDNPSQPNLSIDDAVRQCIRNGQADAVALGQWNDPCSIRGISMYFSGTEIPNTTGHIKNSILNGRSPAYLHRRDVSTINRPSNLRSFCDNITKGQSCDEYPFWSTYENPSGPTYYKAVPESEQLVEYPKSQGRSLGAFYGSTGCNVSKNNGPFVVVPQQEFPTFFICSDGTVYSWY